ncbi:nitrile hydratase accessory protein [Sulfitobacter geojensis]|uniref:Nitrile hydratase accessory protein n=1 Tax=Sulfitobacter geojensis TaxID=1342299 RepID=A0AAE2W275_9RHOB|nr:nitrile hydratase accessory protein [Sulfitobacter geojensis]MBM1691615.1 nitrile hydratase accessory protein [Sulfitobacter geojensis]MBM1695681.1 nitrile hydratase accessory protein [Sulfitobacter geojensis]MBM1707846.1 nitrile hydratase accessory protein [Sulfitobacter geojensis]MBM1711905.1 nitrile hydratase accessory protein [Sulfitobacter geojensis]MBM1715970.1 nitrile hydratase accessory protein [Sulfitobacter geojensis]
MTQDESHRPQPLKTLDGLPVFEHEWQAQILAMADTLITNKSIEPASWSENFGAGLKQAHAAGQPDDLSTYYKVALDTLEMLVTQQCKMTAGELSNKRQAWEQAYIDTPHGEPVRLLNLDSGEPE